MSFLRLLWRAGCRTFVADSLASGNFIKSDAAFSFPYGFKHGTILKISMEEYQRIKDHDWSDKGWQ